MKFKERFIKAVFIFLLGIVALNLSFTAMNEAVIHSEIEKNTISCFPSEVYNHPDFSKEVGSVIKQITSNPFQILLILFSISPSLTILVLVVLWKKIEERSELKKWQI